MIKLNYILPAHWASYLINNDASGLDGSEISDCDFFLTTYGLPKASSCTEEPYFCKQNDARTLPCNVLEFTFLVMA